MWANQMKRSLVIFDLDGTLVRAKSGEFRATGHAEDWEFIPGRDAVVRSLVRSGALCGIATNQGGVAFDFFTVDAMTTEVLAAASQCGISPDYVRMCFNHPKASNPLYAIDDKRRKPGPGMLLEIIAEARTHYPMLRLTDTLMVGDRLEDEGSAKAAGIDFLFADVFFGEDPSPSGEESQP